MTTPEVFRKRKEAVIVGALAFAFAAALNFQGEIKDIDNRRAGCERQNERTDVQWDFINKAAQARLNLAEETTGGERHENLAAAAEYRALAQRLVDAVPEEIREEPSSALTNCDEATPYPWPL